MRRVQASQVRSGAGCGDMAARVDTADARQAVRGGDNTWVRVGQVCVRITAGIGCASTGHTSRYMIDDRHAIV